MSTTTGTTDVAYAAALRHASRGDQAATMAVCRPLLDTVETATRGYRLIGLAAHHAGDEAAAAGWFRRAVLISPSDPATWASLSATGAEVEDRHLRAATLMAPLSAASWLNLGGRLAERGDELDAEKAFRRVVVADPGRAEGWGRTAALVQERRQSAAAERLLERAHRLAPGDLTWTMTLAGWYEARGLEARAVEVYLRALRHRFHPRFANPLAELLRRMRRYDLAIGHIRRTLIHSPADPDAMLAHLLCRRHTCHWGERFQFWSTVFDLLIDAGIARPQPIFRMLWPSTPSQQREAAHAILAGQKKNAVRRPQRSIGWPVGQRDRLRIGLMSASIRDHAVGRAIPEMLETQDRSRFEVFSFNTLPMPDSPLGRRLRAAIEHPIDAVGLTAEEVIASIEGHGIDVLVDLDGFSGGKPGVVATHPAPATVTYFGFAGTSGGLHDYIIADRVVIPPEDERFFDEAVVALPNCFIPLDTARRLPEPPTRVEVGLPEDKVVLTAFHGSSKISADAFAAWMAVLRQAPESVLWVSDPGSEARGNMLAEAGRLGVDAHRLIFAATAGYEEHLARHAIADLYLDTWPYCSHTTGADCLFAGLPLVTRTGHTYHTRVAESILTAAHLPDLVARDTERFVEIASNLANDRALLSGLRNRLVEARRSAPLFDRRRWVRDLERAYEAIADRARRGLPPASIDLSFD